MTTELPPKEFRVNYYVPRLLAEAEPAVVVRVCEAFLDIVEDTRLRCSAGPVGPWSYYVIQPAVVTIDGVQMIVFEDDEALPMGHGVMMIASCQAVPRPNNSRIYGGAYS